MKSRHLPTLQWLFLLFHLNHLWKLSINNDQSRHDNLSDQCLRIDLIWISFCKSMFIILKKMAKKISEGTKLRMIHLGIILMNWLCLFQLYWLHTQKRSQTKKPMEVHAAHRPPITKRKRKFWTLRQTLLNLQKYHLMKSELYSRDNGNPSPVFATFTMLFSFHSSCNVLVFL